MFGFCFFKAMELAISIKQPCLPDYFLKALSGILTTWVFHEVSTRTLANAALQTRNSETLMTDAIQECRTG